MNEILSLRGNFQRTNFDVQRHNIWGEKMPEITSSFQVFEFGIYGQIYIFLSICYDGC